MAKVRNILLILALVMTGGKIYAEITVGIIPIKGNDPNSSKYESRIKEHLVKEGGISIIADNLMKNIIEIHEKAQALGSAYLDISKLKTSEYLISGTVDSGRLTLVAVDVNKGLQIFSGEINLNSGDPSSLLRNISSQIREAIIMDGAGKEREVPGEAAPYMQLLEKFKASLGSDAKESFRYILFYNSGKYQNPRPGEKDMENKGELFLKVIRPNLVRSKLIYLFSKSSPPWIYINVIADKMGKKTKHKFGILELDDGSMGIGIYEPMN